MDDASQNGTTASQKRIKKDASCENIPMVKALYYKTRQICLAKYLVYLLLRCLYDTVNLSNLQLSFPLYVSSMFFSWLLHKTTSFSATYTVPSLLTQLVVEEVSYPPVPSPASLTPPQLFSPGQIHMHKEVETGRGVGDRENQGKDIFFYYTKRGIKDRV